MIMLQRFQMDLVNIINVNMRCYRADFVDNVAAMRAA